MTNTSVTYACDHCGKEVSESGANSLAIIPIRDDNPWKRFRIQLSVWSGVHNNATIEDADLCVNCATTLLEQMVMALRRTGLDGNKWVKK